MKIASGRAWLKSSRSPDTTENARLRSCASAPAPCWPTRPYRRHARRDGGGGIVRDQQRAARNGGQTFGLRDDIRIRAIALRAAEAKSMPSRAAVSISECATLLPSPMNASLTLADAEVFARCHARPPAPGRDGTCR